MTCASCGGPLWMTPECPECQVAMTEGTQPGCRVTVALPADISPWWNPDLYGATWDAVIVTANGDSLDVTTPTGDAEPVDIEFCRPLTSSAGASRAPISRSAPKRARSRGAPDSTAQHPGCGPSLTASSESSPQLGLWSKTSTPVGGPGCPSCGATSGPGDMPLCRFSCAPLTLAFPTLVAASSCWPTPSKRDWRGTSSASWRASNPTPDTLPDAMAAALGLPCETTYWTVPHFVAVLMGFSADWMPPPLPHSGMPSSRRARK